MPRRILLRRNERSETKTVVEVWIGIGGHIDAPVARRLNATKCCVDKMPVLCSCGLEMVYVHRYSGLLAYRDRFVDGGEQITALVSNVR